MAPTTPTCGNRVLDFFAVSRSLTHAAVICRAVSDTGNPTHMPARLYIRAAPRATFVRQVRAPLGFPAVLPHGP